MDRPAAPPSEQNPDPWRAYALAYLREELRDAAPARLEHPAVFARSPLEGEGATVVFEFTTRRGGREPERCFVVVGETEPNYYPAHDLDAAEGFELHLGTRFMLVLGVARVEPAEAPRGGEDASDLEAEARRVVDRVAPGARIDDLALAACFDVQGRRHAVLRCRVAGRPVYVMGGDAPPGFSTHVDLPPQVAYRLHLGHVLRMEPEPGEERD